MPAGIETMYDSNLVEEITVRTEKVVRYSFDTRDEAEGFCIKIDRNARVTKEGFTKVSLMRADFDKRVVTVLITEAQSYGGGLRN